MAAENVTTQPMLKTLEVDGYLHWTEVAVKVDDKVVPLVDYLRDMEARIIAAIRGRD